MRTRRLVLAAVGDESLHRVWLRGRPQFDLFLVYYGAQPGRYAGDADHYLAARGQKWHLIHEAISRSADVVDRYDTVWFPDDDLGIAADDLNRLFEIFEQHGLQLAQPAIADGRNASYEICAERPGTHLRFTRFVEIMAPMFSRSALRTVAPTFPESRSGWGLDFVWPHLLGYEGIAIIDEVRVRHTRPVQSRITADGSDPWDDTVALRRKYGVDDDAERFSVTGAISLRQAGRPVLGLSRQGKAVARRAAKRLLSPALRRPR